MKRGGNLERRARLRADPEVTRAFIARGQRSTAANTKPRAISPASPEQRRHIAGRSCLIPDCNRGPIDPAHVIPRGMLCDGQDQAQACIPLCRFHHTLFDRHALDLLPFQALFKEEIAFAVFRSDLLSVMERLSGCRWRPISEEQAA